MEVTERKESLKLVKVNIPILKCCLNLSETIKAAFKHFYGMLLIGKN